MVGQGPKLNQRAYVTSVTPSVLPKENVAKTYNSHYRTQQEQWLEDHAVLLRDEVFIVVPGTVNMQCGTASKIERSEVAASIVKMRYFNCLRCQTCP